MFSIYKLVWDGHCEVYVGCSMAPDKRLEQHCSIHAAPKVRDAVQRLGRPTMVIIDEALDIDTALTKEMFHIHDLCASVEWMGGLNTAVSRTQPDYRDVPTPRGEPVAVPRHVEPLDRNEAAKMARRRELATQMVQAGLRAAGITPEEVANRPLPPGFGEEMRKLERRRELATQMLNLSRSPH